MRFPDPLIPGTLVRRYKRFLADVELRDGTPVTAHCANPGSMLGLAASGNEVWLSPARNPKRKLRYSLELVRVADAAGQSLVGVNTAHANRIAEEAIAAGSIPELAGYESIRREVSYGTRSRIDLLLNGPDRPPCYVEVKSVTLKRDSAQPGLAEFPDAVTTRGTKHLGELSAMVKDGARAVMLYVVQREDCARFAVAGDIDTTYCETLGQALDGGVEALCYACKIDPTAITLNRFLEFQLP